MTPLQVGDKVSVVHRHYELGLEPYAHIDHANVNVDHLVQGVTWTCSRVHDPLFYRCPDDEENIWWTRGHVKPDSPEALALLTASALSQGEL